jgi:hypothetical protein
MMEVNIDHCIFGKVLLERIVKDFFVGLESVKK